MDNILQTFLFHIFMRIFANTVLTFCSYYLFYAVHFNSIVYATLLFLFNIFLLHSSIYILYVGLYSSTLHEWFFFEQPIYLTGRDWEEKTMRNFPLATIIRVRIHIKITLQIKRHHGIHACHPTEISCNTVLGKKTVTLYMTSA